MHTPRLLIDRGNPRFVECQCNACAHVLDGGSPVPQLLPGKTSPLLRRPGLTLSPVCSDWQITSDSSVRPVLLNSVAAQLLAAFNKGRAPQEVLAHLPPGWPADQTRATLQEMITLGLLVPVDIQPQVPPETPTALIAWLHVTNACNLRCAYCYVPQTNESMSLEVGRQAIDAVFRSAARHNFQRVKLKYAGGEPSLRFGLVEQLHAHAQARADALGLELEAVILSNGVAVSDQMLETLLAQNIHLAISLDGLDGDHDTQRPLANGHGSAHLVLHTIERALALGLLPDVTVTITNRNLSTLPDTVAWLLQRDLRFCLNLYRENDLSADRTSLRLQDDRLITAMRKSFDVIEAHLPSRNLIGSLLDRVQIVIPHHYPCAVGHNHLAIDHHGRIAQCQMDMTHPVTDIWDDDPLAAVQSAPGGIPGLSVDEKEGCADCRWRYWCAGGCPLEAFRATGRYDTRSPHCAIYRALMPEVLRLEALRLVKYYDVDGGTE